MKKKAVFGIVCLLSLGIIACSKDTKSISESKEVMVESSAKHKESKEESNNLKIEKHEEDWQLLIGGFGYVDWNANMPNVGEWAFYDYQYYPNKRVGDTPDPYFFMAEKTFTNDTELEEAYGYKVTENIEEVPEEIMGAERIWTNMGKW